MTCPICGGGMATLILMPKMPICELNDGTTADQSFTYCEGCSHGKLGTIVDPAPLYGKGYSATSASVGSAAGVDNFAWFIKGRITTSRFDWIIDIGGNDGSLLKHFQDGKRLAIDPNATGDYDRINVRIEDADLDFLKGSSKLILSSHTLEHIENPEAIFTKLSDVVTKDDYCAFQFPSLDYLVRDCRIDQIYHQHIHYYSLRSASLMLARYGFEIVAYEFDASHYGALMVLFRNGMGETRGESIAAREIMRANDMFLESANALNARLSVEDGLIGYGASQMLPILHYYLPALSALEYIVDEDAAKTGHKYAQGLHVQPVHDMAAHSVVVTAFNTKMAVRSIVQKLLAAQARDVIVPFNYL